MTDQNQQVETTPPEDKHDPGEFNLIAEVNKYPAWMGDDGKAYVTLRNGDHVRAASNRFKDELMLVATKAGKLPIRSTLEHGAALAEARAKVSGKTYPVAKRVGKHGGKTYIALYDKKRQYVKIGPEGWKVVPVSPCRFAFLEAALPMPEPVTGGRIEDLRQVINVSEADLPLIVGWCVGALSPDLPSPILGLTGGQGTAKSTATRLLASLVDPSKMGALSMPSNERDFRAMAAGCHVMAFDNVSTISDKVSDTLCRVVTGAAMGGRALYTDSDASFSAVKAPLIANGIGSPWTRRQDLSQRTISIELQEIDPCNRVDEQTLMARWDTLRPMLLGCLCDGLSHALREEANVKLPELPRMADWAKLVTAAEGAFGLPQGKTLAAFNRRQHDAILDGLDHSPLAQAVMRLIDTAYPEEQRYNPTDLHKKLAEDGAVSGMPDFPKTPKALTDGLLRLRESLKANGYQVLQARTRNSRLWVLRKRGQVSPAAA